MPKATHASLVLARFDELREGPPSQAQRPKGTLFLNVGADLRAANTTIKDARAFKFAVYGLHDSEQSARKAVEDRVEITPWIADAIEVWAGVLQPFRHFGEANFVDQESPGPQFETLASPPPDDPPVVIVTSVGWDLKGEVDWDRIKRFSDGVAAVRISMTGVSGLHSQQSFSFPGMLEWDGFTVTFWRNLASAMEFAYGPGFHRSQVKIQRERPDGDRTSFTRFIPLHSEGIWHGSDPLA